jgi:potassium-dependent mechanosensitive channel
MKRIKIFILIALSLCTGTQFFAQIATQADTSEAVVEVIPITEITVAATQANSTLLDKKNRLLTEEQESIITKRLDTLLFKLTLIREDPRIHKTETLNFRNLQYLKNEWEFMSAQLEAEQKALTGTLQELENHKIELEKLLTQWNLSLESAGEQSAPQSVIEQIINTATEIDTLLVKFRRDSDFIQEKLVEVSSGLIFSNEILERIRSAQEAATKNLLTLNRPAIWKEFSQTSDTIVIQVQRSLLEDSKTGLIDFYNSYTLRVWIHLFLSIIIIILVYITFNNLKHSIPDTNVRQIDSIRKITNKPFVSGFLISLLLTYILYDSRHESVGFIVAVLLMVPVVIIFNAIITGTSRRYVYMVIIAIVLVQLHRLGYTETLTNRILLLVIILYCMMPFTLILSNKTLRLNILKARFGKILFSILVFTFLLLLVSLFSIIAGGVLLAEFLTHSAVEASAIALIFYTLTLVLNSILITALYSHRLQKFSLLIKHKEIIYSRLVWLINLLSGILWFIFTLKIFTIWDNVSSGLGVILTSSATIGSVEFSLGNLIVLIFIIWLTIWISRLIRIIFEGEDVIRGKLGRGVPAAISLVIRIVVITIGFLIAIAAGGVEMSKLTILLGALGVGIGFGLQNIFNNLVSGIILAFERPINEGDIIEVGTLLGTVKQIGIRASTIHTVDGAEVVVPNGNLISNELINWTLSDQKRRVEVSIGVKYGTDPRKVLDILRDIAIKHDMVLNDPEPLCLFTAHGESSLDFRLLCWIPDADKRFRVASDLNVEVNVALKKAGIEIPFPQRDLHLRSIEDKVIDRISEADKSQS